MRESTRLRAAGGSARRAERACWSRAASLLGLVCSRVLGCVLPQWRLFQLQDPERFVPACSRPESLLFVSSKRSNQEKCDPTFAPPLLCNVGALRCSETGGRRQLAHPCAQTGAPFPAGFLRYSALQAGPGDQEHPFPASPSRAARGKGRRQAASRRCEARQGRELCGKDGRSMGPLSGGGRAEDQPEGTRARRARGFRQHKDVLSKSPGDRTRTRRAGCPEGDRPGCPFSWLLLFGQAKRSDSGRPKGGSKRF
jgi:hypothetical protein